ncbi:MAG: XrtA/PEP-CTERM system-associated ATPase [Leptothrix sp. (in: b-proteobacteria)]
MYESHFGFSSPPFQLNPDPAFYYNSRGHGHALAYLQYGVAQGEGFIVVTGEIGAGKTTLVRTLLDQLDRQKVLAAQIVSTQLESGDLLEAIITAFGIPVQNSSKAYLIATLEAFLTALATQGRRALLIVDEAQNLSLKAIEELRMLSNFQLGNHALLQSFLVGQPELRKLLESPSMEQLRQRVMASCHLGPLGLEETCAYVQHRLMRVGWTGRPRIGEAAFEQIYSWSAGVPRRINRLCNRLLLAAFLEAREEIDAALVELTARELRSEIGESSFEPLLPARPVKPAAAPEPAPAPLPAAPAEVIPEAQVSAPPPRTAEPLVIEPAAVSVPVAPAPIAAPAPVEPNAYAALVPDALREVQELAQHEVADHQVALDALTQLSAAVAQDVVRVEHILRKQGHGVLLCLADTSSAALKIAVVAKALSALPDAPRMLLVNPGMQAQVWPWENMESILPALELGLHLGVPTAPFEQIAPVLFERLGHVIDEFSPIGILSLGTSDALLACSLMARKRGLPLVRLEAGMPGASSDGIFNETLIEQLSDQLFVDSDPVALSRVSRLALPAERVHRLAGRLAADVCHAVEPSMTTAYGACLRHKLPMFLGPRWSSVEDDERPYAVVALSLDPQQPQQVAAVTDVLARVTATHKLIWLANAPTCQAITEWMQRCPELAPRVFVIEPEISSKALRGALFVPYDAAHVLCCDVRSLPDQFSLLRGAVALLTEPGHVLADAAGLLGVPCALWSPQGRLTLRAGSPSRSETLAWDTAILDNYLQQSIERGYPTTMPTFDVAVAGTAAQIASRLRPWIEAQAHAAMAEPTAEPA